MIYTATSIQLKMPTVPTQIQHELMQTIFKHMLPESKKKLIFKIIINVF